MPWRCAGECPGTQLSPEQCLEYLAGEFLATWGYEAHQRKADEPEEAPLGEACEPEDPNSEQTSREDHSACPDNEDLPPAVQISPSQAMLCVFKRDGYVCQYPGCSARAMLHDYHVVRRSKYGSKNRDERDSLTNRITLCAFHHRQVHAGIIGLKGRAAFELEWRRPDLMDAARMRAERKSKTLERRGRPSPRYNACRAQMPSRFR